MIRSHDCLGGRKIMNSVLSTFKESLLARSHSTKSFVNNVLEISRVAVSEEKVCIISKVMD